MKTDNPSLPQKTESMKSPTAHARPAGALAFLLMASLLGTAHADWKISQPDIDGDGNADLVVDGDLLSAKFSAKGGNFVSLYDKVRNFENAKLFPNGRNDGMAQVKLPGISSDLESAIYKFHVTTQPDGAPLVEAAGDVPLSLDGAEAGSLHVVLRYGFETGATRVKVTTRVENHSGRQLNMVPWLKHLLYRGSGTAHADMARTAFLTPYGVWDSEKPIPGRNGQKYGNSTDVHYLTASNWISRTLQPAGPQANTLAMVVEPRRMFKVYTWRKSSEDMMTEEVILGPAEIADGKADEFSYYTTITSALNSPAYSSPLFNLEVTPHPMGVPAATKELTFRMAAVRKLGDVEASGELIRLDAKEAAQPVKLTFVGANERGVAEAKLPVQLAAKGRYRLELKLAAGGKAFLPGQEVGDKDPVVIPIVVDDELSTAVVYTSRAAGADLFPKLQPKTVSAPLAFEDQSLKVFRIPATQRAFEADKYVAKTPKVLPVELAAGANEYQSVQLVLADQQKAPSTLPVAATVLKGPGGAEVRVEQLCRFLYARTEVPSRYSPSYPVGNYPDALTPTDSIDLKPGVMTPLFVTYYVPPKSPAGIYRGEVTVGTRRIPISLKVWNIELPTRPAVDMCAATKAGGMAINPMYFKYKLTPANLPVTADLLAGRWDAVKRQMPDLIAQGMSRTLLGNTPTLMVNPGPERLKEVNAFLKENGWTDYFYARPGLDEASPDKLPLMVERLKAWKAVCSVPTMENYYYDHGAEQLYGLMDIYSRMTVSPWMKERANAGDKFWRVNAMPSALESNLPELNASYLRMVDDNFGGTYLWTVSAWLEMEWGKDWWADPGVGNLEASIIWKKDGGGYLPTIRLEALRDSIEDYTVYSMLKKRVENPRATDNAKALQHAKAVINSAPGKRIKTDADVDAVRNEIGEALSALNE